MRGKFCGAKMRRVRREKLQGGWWITEECPVCGHMHSYEEWEGP